MSETSGTSGSEEDLTTANSLCFDRPACQSNILGYAVSVNPGTTPQWSYC